MKRVKIHYTILGVLILPLLWQTSLAQGPPISTDTPIFLGLEGRGLRTFIKYTSKENATAYAAPMVLPYNLRTDLLVGVVAPFLRISPEGMASKAGIGDVSVFAKYLLLQNDKLRQTFRIAVKLQETFPVGNNNSLPALGLGAYQTTVGLVGAYITTSVGLYSDIGYTAISKGIPDKITYNIAFGYPLLPVTYPPKQVNIYLELNGNSIPDTGQHSIFISPGIQVIPSKKFLIETGVQVPIQEDLPESQKTNVVVTLGTRILIF